MNEPSAKQSGAIAKTLSQLRVVVFDLDGTLIDSHQDIAQAANHALMRSGRPALDATAITTYVGDGSRKLMERASGVAADDPELDRLNADFLQYYAQHPTAFTRVYPGVRATLTHLQKAYTLALCTNKPRITTEPVLRQLALAGYFAVVVAGDDLPQRKPDPAPLLHIARELDVAPAQLAMVGDGVQDIECARRAGALGVGVAFGMKSADGMLASKPDHVVTRFEDLKELFVV